MAALDWTRDGVDWPLREHSRWVEAAGLRWHLQRLPGPAPNAPLVVLLHGTGASSHSWRAVAPVLQSCAELCLIDLPGHAFTDAPPSGSALCGLDGMAAALGQLLAQEGLQPQLLVGHSAGAALALRLCLDGLATPRRVIAFNGAFLPLGGWAAPLLLPAAKWLANGHWLPRGFAWSVQHTGLLQRLLQSTGSRLDPQGQALYRRLAGNPAHSAGALAMMASWDLPSLWRDLPRLQVPLTLVVGEMDRTVPPDQAQHTLQRLPGGYAHRLLRWPGLGHLAHEEAPEAAAELVRAALRD